ncbi:DNA repair protein RecN [Nonlabens ponticola]|uniref:DNA repair protein RecN n=1 Tax=Nonlabens ponticola TaxID=2496866 RepID=A0A3S9MY07_9FLAO|nr:DNA repair protein RecN [Nonlabens ponticola]
MLTHIHIQNYALIDELDLDLSAGLSMITGETGAGKSILLGALGLVTGKRADLSAVRDTSSKCIVEAHYDISKLELEDFFTESGLDHEQQTILRREILPSGKSRAFINDSPTTLSIMSQLGDRLIDIHSQHQTLQLSTDAFQVEVLNAYVNHQTKKAKVTGADVLQDYQATLKSYTQELKKLKELESKQAALIKESDYNSFLLNELEDAELDGVDVEQLETENEQLSNVELITESLQAVDYVILNDDQNVLDQLRDVQSRIKSIEGFSTDYKSLKERLSSVILELEDLQEESSRLTDNLEQDPERLEHINMKLALIDNLYRKHQVDSVKQLLELRDELADKVLTSQSIDGSIKKATAAISQTENSLRDLGKQLHELRSKHLASLEQHILTTVKELGMPDAQFKVRLQKQETFLSHGMDIIQFTFTANRGSDLLPLDKAASGGELSRLMLAIKALLSQCKQLPTILFDEIDTGVSGAIADRMAVIMKNMASSMQVITITHLPQIAAAGAQHMVVRKQVINDRTVSTIQNLDNDSRMEEIAQMLSGGVVSNAARENARILLQ